MCRSAHRHPVAAKGENGARTQQFQYGISGWKSIEVQDLVPP